MSDLPSGGNYRFAAQSDVLVLEVWRRPDLSSVEGARLAEEILAHTKSFASDLRFRALVIDQRNAPPVAGPRTQAALQTMVGAWDALGKPAVIVYGESPTHRLQTERVIRDGAPKKGRAASTMEAALDYVSGR